MNTAHASLFPDLAPATSRPRAIPRRVASCCCCGESAEASVRFTTDPRRPAVMLSPPIRAEVCSRCLTTQPLGAIYRRHVASKDSQAHRGKSR